MKYSIIVLDLDGTLTNHDKVITPKTKAALMKAQEMGSIVVLASGRPTYGVMPLAKELKLDKYGGYVLSYNGAKVISCCSGETIFARELPTESNQKIISLAKEHGVNLLTYDGDMIVTPDASDRYVQIESAVNHLEVKQIDDFEAYVTYPVVKFLMLDDGDYLALVEPKVKAALGRDYSVYRSEPFFLEILPKGVDKALSLARLLEALHLSKDEMICCGDGYNDLSMIQFAGLGVAMENAVLPVRNAADYITASNDHDGVALVVEKFMLS